MRILHVIDSLDPARGGPAVVAQSLASAQTALGHDVRLIIESPSPSEPSSSHVVVTRQKALSCLLPPSARITKLVSHASVVHLHGVWEPLLAACARAARQRGIPYVVTLHGLLDPWSLNVHKWRKRLALALVVRHMLDRAAALHALNCDEQGLIVPLKLRAQCSVVPNGIALDDIIAAAPMPKLFRDQVPGLGDRPFALFLGRLHFKKGLDILADAFALLAERHPDVGLVVAGPDGGAEQSFRLQMQKLNLSNRVWLTGPLFGASKYAAFAAASVFCLPSRQEGFSLAILEAMACRCPVVISDQCHFPEVAEYEAGHVVALRPADVAEALDKVIRNSTEQSRMGVAGRKLVEDRYTWPKVAAQMIEVYARYAGSADKLATMSDENRRS